MRHKRPIRSIARQRWLPLLAIGMLAVAPAVSAQSPSVGAAGPEKTFVFGTNFNPQGGCDATQTVVLALTLSCPQLVSEPLVRLNYATNEVEPALATTWEVAPDMGSVTFHLREGVTFSDGTPFNADAVVFNFSRVWDESSPAHAGGTFPYASQLAFKSIEKIDDMTVKVDLTAPQPNPLWGFTFFPAYIQSPTAVQADPTGYTLKPVGTGPYVINSYQDNVQIDLTRNPSFWGTPPQPDHVVIVINDSQQTLANDLLSGAIDAMENPPVEQIDQMTAAGLKQDIFPSAIEFYFTLNVDKPPTDDPLVRQAMNYAMDKESVAALSKGAGTAMYGAWFPGAYAYNPDTEPYKYDPVKAGQLLDQAGWTLAPGEKVRTKDGQKLTVSEVTQSNASGIEAILAPILISNLQDVGFEVTSTQMEQAALIAALPDKTLANIVQFGDGALFPDPQSILHRLTTEAFPPAEFNTGFYSNPDYDALVAAAKTELDEQKRIDDLKQAQAIARTDAPWIWVVQAATPVMYNPQKLSAVPLYPNSLGIVDINGVTYK